MRRIRFDRLRRMSPREWRWRARDALHVLAERVRTRTAPVRWNRSDIRRVLTTSALEPCVDSIDRGDWTGVQNALTAHIVARRPRFVLDPASAPTLRDRVRERWPFARQDAAHRADRLLEGRYDFLGYRDIQCGRHCRVDWHSDPVHGRLAPRIFYADVPFLSPQIGDHKIIWELNRHQHWLQLGRAGWLTGDTSYTQAILEQLDDWLADNPPFIGVNWASTLEIGFRALSWTWALHCLLGIPNAQPPTPSLASKGTLGRWELGVGNYQTPWLVDMFVALDRQLTHVERHLSHYFSPNTHLTGEALALYVVGTALPELAASQRWVATGRAVLLEEIDRQILPDGGHVERSTHYQRYTLDFYLLATLTARLAGDGAATHRFEDAAGRLADFTRTIADAEGRLPLIGDDDGGMLWPIAGRACDDVRDSLALAAVVLRRPDLAAWGIPEEVAWIAGPDAAGLHVPASTPPTSRLLRNTGYFVARAANDSHAVLDVGPHGYRNGGHAHADALSLTLSVDGHRLLIDPGTSTYTMDPLLRDRMRSTESHNTITLDNRSQSTPDGPFHWQSTVDAHVVAWRSNDAFDWIEATHDGYAPARHRRTVLRTLDCGWLIVDDIAGSERRHSAAAHWHFDPAWDVTHDNGRLRARHADGQTAWMLCAGGDLTLTRGDTAGGVGWCAPVYGQLVSTCTARVATDAAAPFALVTWVASGRAFASPLLRCARLKESDDEAVIIEILDGSRTAVFMMRPTHSSRPRRACRVGEFETDAAMFHYATENGRLQSMSIVDGQHVVTARDRWLSITADGEIADLHLSIHDDEIDLHGSEPPRRVIVHGTAGCTSARINGRDLPLSSKSTDTLLIHGSDSRGFSVENSDSASGASCGAAFARQ